MGGNRFVNLFAVGAVALTLVGCGKGSEPSGALPTVDTSATATPADPTTPPPTFGPIPDSAFVTAPHNPDNQKPQESGPYPKFCYSPYPSDSGIGVRRARVIYYYSPDAKSGYVPDGTVSQTITVYQPGAAAGVVSEFQVVAGGCLSENDGELTKQHKVVSAPKYGDESLLVKTTSSYPNPFPTKPDTIVVDSYVSVVRVGDVVTVLWAAGWEGVSVEQAVIDSFSAQAVGRIKAWLG